MDRPTRLRHIEQADQHVAERARPHLREGRVDRQHGSRHGRRLDVLETFRAAQAPHFVAARPHLQDGKIRTGSGVHPGLRPERNPALGGLLGAWGLGGGATPARHFRGA
jgi:hypothetical protein